MLLVVRMFLVVRPAPFVASDRSVRSGYGKNMRTFWDLLEVGWWAGATGFRLASRKKKKFEEKEAGAMNPRSKKYKHA